MTKTKHDCNVWPLNGQCCHLHQVIVWLSGCLIHCWSRWTLILLWLNPEKLYNLWCYMNPMHWYPVFSLQNFLMHSAILTCIQCLCPSLDYCNVYPPLETITPAHCQCHRACNHAMVSRRACHMTRSTPSWGRQYLCYYTLQFSRRYNLKIGKMPFMAGWAKSREKQIQYTAGNILFRVDKGLQMPVPLGSSLWCGNIELISGLLGECSFMTRQ